MISKLENITSLEPSALRKEINCEILRIPSKMNRVDSNVNSLWALFFDKVLTFWNFIPNKFKHNANYYFKWLKNFEWYLHLIWKIHKE